MAAKRTSKNRARGRAGASAARARRPVREPKPAASAPVPQPPAGPPATVSRPGCRPIDTIHFAASPYLPFSREIPTLYNEPYVRVMARDPGHVFAFWEHGPSPAEKAPGTPLPATGQPARQVLRVYELVRSRSGEQASRFVGDIPLEKNVHSQYIRMPQSGCTYRIELGECDRSGRFAAHAVSNEVGMPDARIHEKPAGSLPFRAEAEKLLEISARSATVLLAPPAAVTGSDILCVEPGAAVAAAQPALGSHFMQQPGGGPDHTSSAGSGQPQ